MQSILKRIWVEKTDDKFGLSIRLVIINPFVLKNLLYYGMSHIYDVSIGSGPSFDISWLYNVYSIY